MSIKCITAGVLALMICLRTPVCASAADVNSLGNEQEITAVEGETAQEQSEEEQDLPVIVRFDYGMHLEHLGDDLRPVGKRRFGGASLIKNKAGALALLVAAGHGNVAQHRLHEIVGKFLFVSVDGQIADADIARCGIIKKQRQLSCRIYLTKIILIKCNNISFN